MAGKKDKSDGAVDGDKSLGKRQLAQRIDILAAVSEQLEARTGGLGERVERLDQAHEALTETGDRLARQVESLAQRGSDLEQGLTQIRSQTQDLAARLEAASGPGKHGKELSALRQRFGELAQHDTRLQESVETVQARIDRLAADLQDTDGRSNELLEQLDALARESTRFQQVEADLAAFHEELSGLMTRTAVLETGKDEDSALVGVQDRVRELEAGLSAVRQDGDAGRQALDERMSRVFDDSRLVLERYQELAGEVQNTGSRVAELQAGLEASRERLPDLGPLSDRLRELERAAQPLEARQQAQQADIERLGQTVDAVRHDQSGLEKRLSEALHNLGVLHDRADSMGEQIGGLERAARHLEDLEQQNTGLLQAQETHRSGVEELRGQLATLGEGVHETTDLIDQEAKRLSALRDQFDSDSRELQHMASVQAQQRDELSALISRLEELEQGRGQDAEASRSDLEALRTRLGEFEDGLRSLGEHGRLTDDKLERTTEDLQALRAHTDAVAGRLEQLSEVPQRVSELESLTGPISGRLDSQDDNLAQLRGQLDRLEQAAEELAGRVADEAGRIAVQSEKSEADQERLAALVQEVSQNGVDLAAVIAKLDGLQESGGQLERGLQEATERANRLAERDRYLERALEAAQDKFNDLGTALDNTGSSIDAVQRGFQDLDDKIAGVRSGQRVLAWSGVVAALVLLALSVAGYLFSEGKQRTERATVNQRLDRIDQRIAGFTGQDAMASGTDGGAAVDAMRQRLDNLDQRVSDLGLSVARQPEIDPEAETRRQDEQVNLLQSMDDLSRRLGGLEDTLKASPPAAPGSPADSVPTTAAVQSAAADAKPATPKSAKQPSPAPGPWEQARRRGAYTVQVLGVGNPDSVQAFVRKRGLKGDLARYRGERQGKPWYVLFQGIYGSRAAARKAASAGGSEGWARAIPKQGELQPLR